MNPRYSPILFGLLFTAFTSVADDNVETFVEASRLGNAEQLAAMLEAGTDVNSQAKFSITALWQAASKEHVAVVKQLLAAKANPNIPDTVWKATPLMLTNNPEIVAMLVAAGAKDAAAKLRAAAASGSFNMVKTIITAATLDDRWLAIARSQAQLAGHQDVVELLEQTAKAALSEPPVLAAEDLQTLVGNYVSERLEEVKVSQTDGQLIFQTSLGQILTLIPRNQSIFDHSAYTYKFDIADGQAFQLSQSSSFSQRIFKRISSSKKPLSIVNQEENDWTLDDAIATTDVWPQFRGLSARGLAVQQNLPENWNVETKESLRWKTAIPGLGNSCPVVWKNRVFISTAVSSAGNADLRIGLYGDGDAANDESVHIWRLYCLASDTGEILWEQSADERIPLVKRHLKSSQANPTPATNGRNVVVLFNSGRLCCFDMDGNQSWQRDLGKLDSGAFNDRDHQWGFGSSPIIYASTIVVQCDLQEDSFVAAFDITSGEEIWRTNRQEVPSWGTPTICTTVEGPQLITNGTNFVRSYDARTGNELWRLGRNAAITVPTPFMAHNLIFVTSGYRPIQPIYAVRTDARGDISLADGEESNSHISWSQDRGGPYLPSPLAYGNYLYTCGNNGLVTCYDAKTGDRIYRKRCGRGSATSFTASLVAADGKIYVTSESGTVFTIKAGPNYELINENSLGEICLATPAIANQQLLFRTQHHLVSIGQLDTPNKSEEE
ncbi:MAG: PQQ-binding-like beta-propeller repeat protein [Pirellulaceae bacterium]|nr:PQQ-binding-like beta-propeller repeat protein [Pirellulaceae bacterium]